MLFILNSVFTIMFYVVRWPKLDPTCICFEEFLNQLNLLYIYICNRTRYMCHMIKWTFEIPQHRVELSTSMLTSPMLMRCHRLINQFNIINYLQTPIETCTQQRVRKGNEKTIDNYKPWSFPPSFLKEQATKLWTPARTANI
jgi:hypothetical protein